MYCCWYLYRNWSEQAELCNVYELYLLKYETKLQLELGTCIKKLINNLAATATQKVLTATVLAALITALIVPVTLVSILCV